MIRLSTSTQKALVLRLVLATLAVVWAMPVWAQGVGVQEPTRGSQNGNSPPTLLDQWGEMTPTNKDVDLATQRGGMINYGEHGETAKKVPGPTLPPKIWPIITKPYTPQGPEKMMAWAKEMDKVTGYSKPELAVSISAPR